MMAANGQPTMDDVASRAGVSKSAVSLVLNNKPGTSVDLRSAVMKAVDELGYRLPDRRPTHRSPDSRTITVIVRAEQGSATTDITGIFIDYLRGIRRYVREQQLNMTLISGYQDGDPHNLAAQLLDEEDAFVGGAILVGMSATSKLVHRIVRQGIPAVALSRQWPHIPISTVSQDHRQQATIALQHLVKLGHTRIGFVASEADRTADWCQWRLDIFREIILTLDENDVDRNVDEFISFGSNGIEATKSLLARRPDVTAIFAIHCGRSVEVVEAIQQLGLSIPDDLSVITLGNSTPIPDGQPGLTTVDFSVAKLGYLAAESMHRQMNENDILQSNIVMRSRLIERESCAPPRIVQR